MYPYEIIFDMGLYEIMLCAGVISAMLIFRHFSDKLHLSAKLHNFVLLNAVVTVTGGYFSAVVFQAFYNYLGGEKFEINQGTGATFLGGLIGGAAVFIGVYFGIGFFVFRKRDREHIKMFPQIADIAAVCIPFAHGFGRIGCLMAGCCYGKVFDEPEWFTVRFLRLDINDEVIGYRYALPVQLYEAVFLFLLGAVLWYMLNREKKGLLAYYMIAYGAWRFFAEFLRADDRGSTLVSFLSPSQLVSVLMIVGGTVIEVLHFIHNKKADEK